MSAREPHAASIHDLRAVVEPGETISYSEVIIRLKRVGRPTSGIGLVCERIRFRGAGGSWRGGEMVSWRKPTFDRENEGDWTDGEMFVTRREDDDASS